MKGVAEVVLNRSGLSDLVRRRLRGRSAVLAYHNVVPDDQPVTGDTSLHLRQSAFAAQLDLLAGSFSVIPLTEVLRPFDKSSSRPRIAITFDDGYRGAVALGIEELVRRGLPATLFAAPGQLGDQSFWWDRLAARDGSGLDASFRRLAVERLQGDQVQIERWAKEKQMPTTEVPSQWRTVSIAELQEAVLRPGISVASHSWSHKNLAALTETELQEELQSSRAWLRERIQAVIPWLSYPYGIATKAVAQAAQEAGYEAALRIEGGWIERSPTELYRLPRINVPSGISLEGFRLRLAGLFTR